MDFDAAALIYSVELKAKTGQAILRDGSVVRCQVERNGTEVYIENISVRRGRAGRLFWKGTNEMFDGMTLFISNICGRNELEVLRFGIEMIVQDLAADGDMLWRADA
jgi:hypothetical protein